MIWEALESLSSYLSYVSQVPAIFLKNLCFQQKHHDHLLDESKADKADQTEKIF